MVGLLVNLCKIMMMGDFSKTASRYQRYYAKVYALDGDIAKAKELYHILINNFEIHFDDEDIKFMDQ